MIERDRRDLIASIYDSIGEEGAVPNVMSRMSAHLGASIAFWYVLHKGARGNAARTPFLFDGALGVGMRTLQEFRDEMWRHDYALGAASVTNRTTETRDLISDAELAKNDFYHWLKASAGVERRIGRSTDFAEDLVAGWSFHMPTGLRRHERERAEFDLLAPHLRNLFKLTSQFGDLATQRDALEQIVNAQGHAVLLLSGDGAVCWASETAMRLCARDDGLGLSGNRMTFARAAERHAFEALLQRAVRPDALASSGALGQLAVARPSGSYPFILELSPAPAPFRRQLHSRGTFILTVYDHAALVDPQPERWRAMFALTPMEAKVAMLTMRGLPDATIAARLGIGVGTVRTHQKQLLAKTGTGSKAEAAHLLTRLS